MQCIMSSYNHPSKLDFYMINLFLYRCCICITYIRIKKNKKIDELSSVNPSKVNFAQEGFPPPPLLSAECHPVTRFLCITFVITLSFSGRIEEFAL